jgi:hypothetical protein
VSEVGTTLKASPITVRIAAGTGLFTRALLAHPEWSSIRFLKAVEPSEGMRETFLKYTPDDRVVLSEGTFNNMGLETGWADLVVIAQVNLFLCSHLTLIFHSCRKAFHWCLNFEAVREDIETGRSSSAHLEYRK